MNFPDNSFYIGNEKTGENLRKIGGKMLKQKKFVMFIFRNWESRLNGVFMDLMYFSDNIEAYKFANAHNLIVSVQKI